MRKKFNFYDMHYLLTGNVAGEIAICMELAKLKELKFVDNSITVTVTSDELYDIDIVSIKYSDDEGLVFCDEEGGTYDAFDITFTSLVDLYNEVYSICKGIVDKRNDEKNCNKKYS